MGDVVITLLPGDCRETLRTLADASVDSVVTDPPAGIAFMNKTWDHHKGGRDAWIAWLTVVMTECYRVLKPGGHAAVWALPRTAHWTATAIEDAGFEIRDKCYHHFGSGFPKSKNVGNGIGTALKPATEEWIIARKPLTGTVAATVAAWGTGGLNIDASRVQGPPSTHGGHRRPANVYAGQWQTEAEDYSENPAGRWPPNVLLTHSAACNGHCAPDCPVAALDRQSGERTSVRSARGGASGNKVYGKFAEATGYECGYTDTGGASRFFPVLPWDPATDVPFMYQPKASRAERNAGCAGLPERESDVFGDDEWGRRERNVKPSTNHHPTVKPVALMRWLVRLVTPPGGTVLDPFLGSGTTGIAAVHEGCAFIGCEQDADYLAIAQARIAHARQAQPGAIQAALLTEGVA
jgi:site-specific DNA-methyltransferase (adenine-specific)